MTGITSNQMEMVQVKILLEVKEASQHPRNESRKSKFDIPVESDV